MAVRVPAHTMLCPTDSGEGEGPLAIRAVKMDRPYGPQQVMDGEGLAVCVASSKVTVEVGGSRAVVGTMAVGTRKDLVVEAVAHSGMD